MNTENLLEITQLAKTKLGSLVLVVDDYGKEYVQQTFSREILEKHRVKERATLLHQHPHPNLVRIEALEQSGSQFRLITEYVEGRTLVDLLNNKQLTEVQAEQFWHEAQAALSHLHGLGLKHGDISTANFVLGNDGCWRLWDLFSPPGAGTEGYGSKTVKGTFEYSCAADLKALEKIADEIYAYQKRGVNNSNAAALNDLEATSVASIRAQALATTYQPPSRTWIWQQRIKTWLTQLPKPSLGLIAAIVIASGLAWGLLMQSSSVINANASDNNAASKPASDVATLEQSNTQEERNAPVNRESQVEDRVPSRPREILEDLLERRDESLMKLDFKGISQIAVPHGAAWLADQEILKKLQQQHLQIKELRTAIKDFTILREEAKRIRVQARLSQGKYLECRLSETSMDAACRQVFDINQQNYVIDLEKSEDGHATWLIKELAAAD
ncbi:hypothetical protein BSR28_03670 [Boudabousia liubingyangii]|uniref:protein kinase domain-containing protein n=1 Tax=Boudabousia liubingyangii TaxID=1921764 RepID=UPI00093C5EAF|nr:protein kinase [Boudabousia liubingyangii]OKL47600.1 hypothetical protein BSR28_03670 [Boudabousia liubingyangii]